MLHGGHEPPLHCHSSYCAVYNSTYLSIYIYIYIFIEREIQLLRSTILLQNHYHTEQHSNYHHYSASNIQTLSFVFFRSIYTLLPSGTQL